MLQLVSVKACDAVCKNKSFQTVKLIEKLSRQLIGVLRMGTG